LKSYFIFFCRSFLLAAAPHTGGFAAFSRLRRLWSLRLRPALTRYDRCA